MTTAEVAPAPGVARRDGILLLSALLLAAVALRPQLVGAGPLIPDIQDDLGASHSVAGLVGTIPVLCMGLFAPAAGLVSARWGLRAGMAGCLLAIAAFGLGRAAAPGIATLLALTFPIGIAMAVAGTLLPVAVKQRFAHRPAFASGIGVTGINIGAAVSSAVAVPLASAWGGWRGALAAFSLATLAICAGWLALSRGDWTERSAARPPRLPVAAAGRVDDRARVRPAVGRLLRPRGVDRRRLRGARLERGARGRRARGDGHRRGPGRRSSCRGSPTAWARAAGGCGSPPAASALATFGFAAIPGGAFAWAVFTGIALGTVFPISLTMCLDVARAPAEAGAAAALMFLAGYPIAALGPLGAGAARDLTGSFDASLWALFGTAAVMAAVLAPLTSARGCGRRAR